MLSLANSFAWASLGRRLRGAAEGGRYDVQSRHCWRYPGFAGTKNF